MEILLSLVTISDENSEVFAASIDFLCVTCASGNLVLSAYWHIISSLDDMLTKATRSKNSKRFTAYIKLMYYATFLPECQAHCAKAKGFPHHLLHALSLRPVSPYTLLALRQFCKPRDSKSFFVSNSKYLFLHLYL
ncbi:hypothetical protein BC829DRAFT_14496 [Chytridium lagenaria]|nr:hypothetical protein BC829DRAFT_14496 [Chytridium lagenaria]